MTVKHIPAVTARVHFGELMQKSYKNGDRFIVEKSGIPMVVILSASEYQRMVQVQEERFKVLDEIKASLPNVPAEQIEADVAEAVRAVRKKKSRA